MAQHPSLAGLVFAVIWTSFSPAAAETDVPTVDLADAEGPVVRVIEEAAAHVASAPSSADAWGAYAMVLHAHDWTTAADRCYAQGQRLAWNDFRWAYYRGILLTESDPAQALELLERAAQIDPAYGPAFIRLGAAYREAGREDEALRSFEESLRLAPRNASAQIHLGQLELQRGNVERAIELLESALIDRRNDATVLSALARAYARSGDRDRARAMADAAHRTSTGRLYDDPRFNVVVMKGMTKRSFLTRSNVLFESGLAAQAEAELRRGIEVGHDEGAMQGGLARLFMNTRSFEASVDAAQAAIAAGNRLSNVYYPLGVSLMELGKLAEADMALAASIDANPQNEVALDMYGRLATRRGDHEAALEWWDRSLAIKVAPLVQRRRAACLVRLGRAHEAIAVLARLCAVAPSEPALWAELGEAHIAAGATDAAIESFELAARDAKLPRPGRRLVALLMQQQRWGDALLQLRALRQRFPPRHQRRQRHLVAHGDLPRRECSRRGQGGTGHHAVRRPDEAGRARTARHTCRCARRGGPAGPGSGRDGRSADACT